MASWIEGHRLRCGPLTDAASIFGASLGVERDPPTGPHGLLALARAIERHLEVPPKDDEHERVFVELAGAYLGVLLCDALPEGQHATRNDQHGLRFGARGFFDPFVAIERVMQAGDVRATLAQQVTLAENEARGASNVAPTWSDVELQIVPRLVGPRFFSRISERTNGQPLCAQRLVGEVRICFVLRQPGRARYVGNAELEHWQKTPAELRHAALSNLANCSAAARLLRLDAGRGALVVARTGDGLDSSRLLLPGLHDVLAPELGSPFAVAVPHRDALFACSLRSRVALSEMRDRAAREAARAAHAITRELFAVAPGGRISRLPAR